MIAIDTNVLVRLLAGDDAVQLKRASRLVARSQVFIAITVLLEAEWVLRSAYRFKEAQIAAAFRSLLGLETVTPESPAILAQALEGYEAGLDFADALHLASAHEATAFFTFDRTLARDARRAGIAVEMVPD